MKLDLKIVDSGATTIDGPDLRIVQEKPVSRWNVQLSYSNIEFVAQLTDVLLIFISSIAAGLAYQRFVLGVHDDGMRLGALGAVVAAVFVSIATLKGHYAPKQLISWEWQGKNILWLWIGTFLFFTATAFALKAGEGFSRGATMCFFVTGLFALIASRLVWSPLIRRAMRTGSLRLRKAVLISGQRDLVNGTLLANFENHGVRIERIFALPTFGTSAGVKFRELGDQVISFFRDSEADEVLIHCSLHNPSEINALVSQLRVLAAPIVLVPDTGIGEIVTKPTRWIGSSVSFELHRPPLTNFEQSVKRWIDVAGATLGLVGLFPLMVITAIAIRFDSPGPVLFKQTRRGFNGKQFVIFKFRTMTVLEDGDNVRQCRPNDDRVTRLGRWLRRTSIDELPQLINVLRGEMSMVGPRPHAAAHDTHYEKLIANYAFRQHVKPGITGWAQVNSFRGATPTVASMRRRVDSDLWYIDNWSLWLDVRILLKTVGVVIKQNNAF